MRPTLSVLIVTWNSREELARSLPALLPELGEGDELIVVDNDSADGTPEAVAELAPQARLVRAAATSASPRPATSAPARRGGELLVILNPDAAPRPGWGEAIRRPWTRAARLGRLAGAGRRGRRADDQLGRQPGPLHRHRLGRGPRSAAGRGAAGRRGDGALRRLPGDPARGPGRRSAASRPSSSSTTRTSTSRCGCGWPAARWGSSRRRSSTTTTSSAPASTSGAGWSATATLSCCAPIPAPCWSCWRRPCWRPRSPSTRSPPGAAGGARSSPATWKRSVGCRDCCASGAPVQAARSVSAAELAAWLTPDLDSPFIPAVARSAPVRLLLRAYWRAVRLLLRAL